MTSAKYRHALPQLGETRLLTDGGLETTLIFHDGLDLPLFASFDALRTVSGRAILQAYYTRYVEIAVAHGTGFILDSATWRASKDGGDRLGFTDEALAAVNREAVELLFELRQTFEADQPFLISGNIGPRGDGYNPETLMSAEEAEAYHGVQVAVLDEAGVDMITAVTITDVGEGLGIARAAARRGISLALSFTVETDGRLPSGQTLGSAIEEIDAETATAPAYYMINCAHPEHFRDAVAGGEAWTRRIRGLRANASRLSDAELDEAETLVDGNPVELARDYAELIALLPNLRVFGGCCGTDHRHVDHMAEACLGDRAVA